MEGRKTETATECKTRISMLSPDLLSNLSVGALNFCSIGDTAAPTAGSWD